MARLLTSTRVGVSDRLLKSTIAADVIHSGAITQTMPSFSQALTGTVSPIPILDIIGGIREGKYTKLITYK